MRAAIIGFGKIAHGQFGKARLPLTHLGAYQALRRRINLVAVADPDRRNLELAAKLIPHVRVYEDHKEMLAQERLDVASICSPDDLHVDHLEDVSGSGVRGIWCEKPIATDAGQLRRLTALAPDLPHVQVNFWRRFVPEIRILRERIRAGDFGRVNCLAGYYPEGWLRNGSHLIDLIKFFVGDVKIVCHTRNDFNGEPQVIASGVAAGGASWSAMPVPRDQYNLFELEMLCQRARARIVQNGRSIEIIRDMKDPEFRHLRILQTRIQQTNCRWNRAFIVSLGDLLDCVEGKSSQTISPLDNAIAVAQAMAAVLPKL